MRRLGTLLTSLLLLHLTLGGADLTCARHGVHGAPEVGQPGTSSHEHHHPAAPPERTGHDETGCDVPTLPACCQGLASCGVSIAGDTACAAADLSHLAAGMLTTAEDAPASWALEPDPPPPKA